MNLQITFEALKFYKLKSERAIQRWFILLYFINVAIWFLPFVDTDFSEIFQSMNQIATGQMVQMPITTGNWAFIGLTVLVQVINLFFIFSYAALYVSDRTKEAGKLQPARYLYAWPRLLLLLVLLVVPALLSVLLFMIPLLVFVTMMYFLPLNLIMQKLPLPVAMQASFQQTKGQRLLIFAQILFLSILLTFPESIILGFFSESLIASVLIQSFFRVFMVFSQGRLMGIFYFFMVRKEPVFNSANTKDDDQTRK